MKKVRSVIGVILVTVMMAMPVQAADIRPIMMSEGDVTETVDGVTFTVRKDFNHPYVEYTSAYGDEYNRQLVVEMTITNHSGEALGYTAYLTATDADDEELENLDSLAAARFGTVEDNASVTVQAIYLLEEDNDVSTFELNYQFMDYSEEYLEDMNLYANGLLTATDIALRYPQIPITFTINYPMQQPGVGGGGRLSAIRGSVLK